MGSRRRDSFVFDNRRFAPMPTRPRRTSSLMVTLEVVLDAARMVRQLSRLDLAAEAEIALIEHSPSDQSLI